MYNGSGHAIDRTRRRGEEASPSERRIRGSPSSASSPVSELRIRLEDGSVFRHTFPACKWRDYFLDERLAKTFKCMIGSTLVRRLYCSLNIQTESETLTFGPISIVVFYNSSVLNIKGNYFVKSD